MSTLLEDQFMEEFTGDQSANLASVIAPLIADVAANVSAIALTIVDGDVTHAPSGNAVFDALALKNNVAYVPDEDTDWSPVPTTIQEALDQLAARVTALEP